jgi:hypothetical protein
MAVTSLYLLCLDAIYSVNLVRKWTLERNAIGHTHACFKRGKGVKLNGILECKFMSKSRTVQQPQPDDANPNTAESMVENAHRTPACLPVRIQGQMMPLPRAPSVDTLFGTSRQACLHCCVASSAQRHSSWLDAPRSAKFQDDTQETTTIPG